MRHDFQNRIYRTLIKVVPVNLLIKSGKCGFFGDLFIALNGIRFSQLNNTLCKVMWDKNSLYFDNKLEENVWLAYFAQDSFDFRKNASHSTFDIPYHPGSDEFNYHKGLSPRHSINKALSEFCILREDIKTVIDNFCEKHFHGHMLGIHIRQTDAARNEENRKSVEVQTFVSEAKCYMKANPNSKIFLATDSQDAVEIFTDIFKHRVVFSESLRSTDGTSLHGHYDDGVSGRPYQKGLEVLIDAYLLSKCDYLLRTHSRVTCFSLCLNPELDFLDLEVKYKDEKRTPWLFE